MKHYYFPENPNKDLNNDLPPSLQRMNNMCPICKGHSIYYGIDKETGKDTKIWCKYCTGQDRIEVIYNDTI